MRYGALQRLLPSPLRRYVMDFEARMDQAVERLARELPSRSIVLDAGAGEGRHASLFAGHRYVAVDLGIGDTDWDYGRLDCVADLAALPFRAASVDACLNIVTLEHVREPKAVLQELARVLKPGGRLLLIAPQSWEVHQAPHDYYRYTAHGLGYLLEETGFGRLDIQPMGGFFRLLSRRLLNGLQFFPPVLLPLAVLALAPPALLLPLLDFLDREKSFTLGYVCTAYKPS